MNIIGKFINYPNLLKKIWKKTAEIDNGFFRHIYLFLDCIYAQRIYHCELNEYVLYEFYKHKNSYRKNFLLLRHQSDWYKKVNPKGFTKSKAWLYEKLEKFYGRRLIRLSECTQEEFVHFLKSNKKVVVKPNDGSCGTGIKALEYTDEESAVKYFCELKDKNYVCEEFLTQHPDLAVLTPYSVNTVRVLSLCDGNNVHIIDCALRMSLNKKCVDNLKNGGIGAVVDVNSGLVVSDGKDYNGNIYKEHPVTNAKIKGVQIPFWNEALEMLREAHMIMKDCPILGWDVAVTKHGPAIIEANNAPGPTIHQYIDLIPKGEMILDYIRKNKSKNRVIYDDGKII